MLAPAVVAGVLLLIAIAPLEYGYYTFLRIAVTVTAVWVVVAAVRSRQDGWVVAGAIVAILFNPVIPVWLTKGIWTPIDIGTSVLVVLAGVFVRVRRERVSGEEEQCAPVSGGVPWPHSGAGGSASMPAPRPAASSESESQGMSPGQWTWMALGNLACAAALVFVVALATAHHWTKVDVAAQEATFSTETYQTGSYNISNDRDSPCYVGQDWTSCINVMVGIHNSTCVGVSLTASGHRLCSRYGDAIEQMKQADDWGSTVSELGDWGHLSRIAETSTREVANDDYRPAVTHEAVCHLRFLGECEQLPGD